MKLSIANDFYPYPDGRYQKVDGEFCGEVFRNTKLLPAFEQARQNNETLEVSLDGVEMLGVSFLDEAFGGLVRKLMAEGVNFDLIEKTVKITSQSPEHDYFIRKSIKFMKKAALKAK